LAETGAVYNIGSIYNIIYPASGGAPDWVYTNTNADLCYVFELRPDSENEDDFGFVLPPEFIEPTGREVFAFHTALANEYLNNNL